jgi:hypothetical protein
MRSKLILPGILIAVLGIAACGSSKKSSTTTPTGTTTPTAAKAAPKGKKAKKAAVPSRTYHVKMTGKAETPPGPPKATGRAVVTLHGKTLQVCWRFTALHGFTGATFAHIHKGPKGTSGPIVIPFSTGPKLNHKGCAHSTAALIKAIAKNPHAYYVNIHSKKNPGGAVRAQL